MKTAVYFCTCGTNISDRIDSGRVRQQIEVECTPVCYKTAAFLCSEQGTSWLAEDLAAEQPDRVVIAACSPRDHENTFMAAMKEANLNPYLMRMVNIREQIAWVTPDPVQATDKAARAIQAAMAGAALQEPLETRELQVSPAVLIIGAGPAGLKAALTLAEAGRQVTLVEKSPVMGGMPVRYEETYPALECGSCMLDPLMGEILHGPHAHNIELLTLSELQGVTGYFGNFTATVRQAPRFVDTAQCIGCGACLEPCPATAPNQFNYCMDQRPAISFPFAGALPAVPFIDRESCTRFTEGSDCCACSQVCPMGEGIIRYDDVEHLHQRTVGAIILATGFSLYDCNRLPNLGYGVLPQVYTSLEFERMMASNGPTGGEILTPSGEPPRSIAIIHCVGSLDERHRDYCSGICCGYAFKFNHIVSNRLPETRIYHLFKELALPGKEESALHRHARHNGNSRFIRYTDLDDLHISGEAGATITFSGADSHEPVTADMVVLCPAVDPAEQTGALGDLLEVSRDRFGFFQELHGRMDGAKSRIRGIYLAGACQGPMDIRQATSTGMAAAGYVLSELAQGKSIQLEAITAAVEEEFCAGCRVCVKVCPYAAITFDAEKDKSSINSVLCRGCGACVAACPLSAIKGSHFSDEVIMAELGELLK